MGSIAQGFSPSLQSERLEREEAQAETKLGTNHRAKIADLHLRGDERIEQEMAGQERATRKRWRESRSDRARARAREAVTLDEVPNFPSGPRDLVEEKNWKTVRRGRFKKPEGIMILEGRAVAMGIEKRARNKNEHHKKCLHLADNHSFVLAGEKGRSSVYSILVLLRRIASLCLAADISLKLRFLEGKRNPADAPSRAFSNRTKDKGALWRPNH